MEETLIPHLLEQLMKQHHEIETIKKRLEEECSKDTIWKQFYASLNFEIRTPLSVIRTSAGIVERYYDRLSDAKRQEHLRIIDMQVETIMTLLDKLTQAYHENFHANTQ